MAKKISWWQASEILGISDRQMRRWRKWYEEFGFRGLFDRRRGEPLPKRAAVATVERVLEPYRERYFDLNMRHVDEKLGAQHQIRLSCSWVRRILQGAGMVARGRKPRSRTSPTCGSIETSTLDVRFRTLQASAVFSLGQI
jgi:transposase